MCEVSGCSPHLPPAWAEEVKMLFGKPPSDTLLLEANRKALCFRQRGASLGVAQQPLSCPRARPLSLGSSRTTLWHPTQQQFSGCRVTITAA